MKTFLKIFLILFAGLIFNSCSKEGCTDPTAFNYNIEADTDDGSCDYEGCTDPMAVNYDSSATINSECIYDQIGSWTSTHQEVNINVTMTLLGIPLIDTSTTESIHPDSLDPTGLDFINDGTMTIHYRNQPSEDGIWTRTNDDLLMTLQDTSMTFTIDSVYGPFLRLYSYQSQTTTDPTTGAEVNYNYSLNWDLNRN